MVELNEICWDHQYLWSKMKKHSNNIVSTWNERRYVQMLLVLISVKYYNGYGNDFYEK